VIKVADYILLVSTITIMLLLAEVGFRFVAYRKDVNTLESVGETSSIPKDGEVVNLGRIIRLSKNPHIIYELIPSLSVIFTYKRLNRNVPITINSDGFRGKAIPVDKHAQSKRIVGIGDSLMFGWGVNDDETYLSLLSEQLNAKYPEMTWEIINMAVPGYNTVMEVETLKEKGLHYKPDIVIIHFCDNDFSLPNFIREQEDYFALDQSFIIKYFRGTLKTIKRIRPPRNSNGRIEDDPQRIPKQYRDMVGVQAYYRAMEELKALSIKHKFDVVVLAYRPNARIKKICKQLGLRMVEMFSLWQRYASEQGILDADGVWRIIPKDFHPSAIAHKFIANTLSETVVQLNLNNPEIR